VDIANGKYQYGKKSYPYQTIAPLPYTSRRGDLVEYRKTFFFLWTQIT